MGLGAEPGVGGSECEAQDSMHFMGQGIAIPEMADSATGRSIVPVRGAIGELVYTAIHRECTPLIRPRMNDIIEVVDDAPSRAAGRGSPLPHRCPGVNRSRSRTVPSGREGVKYDLTSRSVGDLDLSEHDKRQG
ncbi:MAG TPA: hypothetical protein VFJ72_06875 [Rubrobacteraceae bacterium]|nr:hypothetical protein [Rubrobacteraceae bacterium]